MLIIIFYTLILFISEMMKKKRKINLIIDKPPSLFNFLTEFKSSWSIINSFRACIANSSYIIVIIIIITLFLSDRLIHFPAFITLSLLLLYVLLPLIYGLITRVNYYLKFVNEERGNEDNNYMKEGEDEEEEEVESNSNNSKKKYNDNNNQNNKQNNVMKFVILLLIDWIEIFLCFITLHLVVEYISFSFYAWLYTIGEDASFSV